MKRVVITGTGIVSCIGNDAATVTQSLREGKSGIVAMPEFAEKGLRSQVAGKPQIDLDALIDRKQRRFMGDAAAYAYLSLKDAIAQAGLTPEQVSHPRTGLIMGSGGASSANQVEAADRIEAAVQKVLVQGLRTPDIYSEGTTKVGTVQMGDAVVKALG